MTRARVEIAPDPAAAGRVAGEIVLRGVEAAISARGRATLAVSGGETPRPMFEHLAHAAIEWDRVTIVQVDERVVPAGSADRNATLVEDTLLRARPAPRWLPVPVERGAATAAHVYASALQQATAGEPLDVVHLGLGDDGHTASLFPVEFDPTSPDTVSPTAQHGGWRRVTLTLAPIAAALQRVVLVAGTAKADALRRALDRDPALPWGHIPATGTTFVVDPELADTAGI